MKILDRLVAGSFLRLFVVSVLATPPLFMLGEFTENLDRYVDAGLTGAEIARAYFFMMPQWLIWSFPIASLIATVFTVHGMTVHREIVAAKAGGISFHRLVAPILVIAVLLTGVALYLTDLAPRSVKRANQILEQRDPSRSWRSDFVYITDEGLTLEARRLTTEDDGSMRSVVLHRPPGPDRPALFVQARTADWDPSGRWTFRNGWFRSVWKGEAIGSARFEEAWVPHLEETPEDLLQETPEEEEMTYAELETLAERIVRSGGQPFELEVKMEQKLAIPLATFVIILFGTPLATSSRRGGAAFGIGVALGTTILYMVLLRVAGGFGESGTLPPVWAAWLPNLIFLVAGLSLMSRVRT